MEVILLHKNNICNSILQSIGKTPIIKLSRLCADMPATVFAKAEFLNPSGSMKDRIALKIIEDAEQSGCLQPGNTVVEITSGNTGISLAMVCAVKGYKFIAVMSAGNSPERKMILEALGATVKLVPQHPGGKPGQVTGEDLKLVEESGRKLAKELNAFLSDQFNNFSNIAAHIQTTGKEIWEEMNGEIDIFLDVVGTAGTFIGISSALKNFNPRIQCLAVEPSTAPILAGMPIITPEHKLQGSSYAMIPSLWNPSYCDGYLTVSDQEAIKTAQMLATKEGILVGYTAGGNVAAAIKLAQTAAPGTRIITILCDNGMKYLSTDLFKAH
ncbi:MAG: cysteine synthase [Firmicutes bacterium]|nr:cysteine synthase [Bacillota bacterium]